MKKRILIGMGLSLVTLTGIVAANRSQPAYLGSRPSDVWSVTQEGPYAGDLPRYKVTLASFFSGLSSRLEQASLRTLNDKSDVLPSFKKLLHANGICFAGTWNITEDSPYSGYFKQGAVGRIIVRASAALSEIDQGQKRSFGIAGKIFPTDDANDSRALKTANFFVIDNLGGTYIPNFRDTTMTNDIADVDFGLANVGSSGIALAAVRALTNADKATGGNDPNIRQVYPIAELGEEPGATIITPQWFKLQGRPGPRNEAKDFRDELRLDNNNGELVFDIFVTSEGERGKPKKNWLKIGYIELNEDSLSLGCDTRLHFTHPVWRNDLKFN
jgi:hypothetical protein